VMEGGHERTAASHVDQRRWERTCNIPQLHAYCPDEGESPRHRRGPRWPGCCCHVTSSRLTSGIKAQHHAGMHGTGQRSGERRWRDWLGHSRIGACGSCRRAVFATSGGSSGSPRMTRGCRTAASRPACTVIEPDGSRLIFVTSVKAGPWHENGL
jgi:hypothetical protein